MVRAGLVCVLLAITTAARAQDCPKDDFSPICSDMRAEHRFEGADRELNLVYQHLLRQMSKPSGEDLDYPTLKAKFIEAQRKWISFRDAECEAWYVVNEAGTGRNSDQMQCLIDRTHDRTKELKQWQADLP